MLVLLASLLAFDHTSDAAPLHDPMRPVSEITRTSFTLQYYTSKPTNTRIEMREGDIPRTAWRGPDHTPRNPSKDPLPNEKMWIVEPDKALHTVHKVKVTGLKPGKRYFYRVYDPTVTPSAQEQLWGAGDGYRREYGICTLAPDGSKTIIHLPVKVLLMPNVVNVASAYDSGTAAPEPPKASEADIQKIKDEFLVSSRFFWVNSGMRLWVDYQFFIDDRWQRWGPEPAQASGFYKGLPENRSYSGEDYKQPGGGEHTVLDTTNVPGTRREPIVEGRPYSNQVEMAWPRRWNKDAKRWEFYNSGGGTYGVDDWPRGFPSRSQFLGGGDTAWLATHEVHHGLESIGTYSLSNREDERIVFNHYGPRRRVTRDDGSVDEQTWTTTARHGEHWDGMAYWDRTLSDAQWLRIYFGYPLVVKDRDEDGFPDDDPRLPLDEKRFGSSASKVETDGRMPDLQKAMLSTWVPGPLQTSWTKPPFQAIKPNPTDPDSDGDGLEDGLDPYPLYPFEPFIVPGRRDIDGVANDWIDVPVAGAFTKGGLDVSWKQSHDEGGYYGAFFLKGPWKRVVITLDGEGLGVYSGVGVLGFELSRREGPLPQGWTEVERGIGRYRPTFQGAPGLKIVAKDLPDGTSFLEFKLPNRGDGPWFWQGGGREIGAVINVWDKDGRGYSMYEPYRAFYARMLEPVGKEPLPSGGPAELGPDARVLKPGDPALKIEKGWTLQEGVYKHSGDESAIYLDGLRATSFDIWANIEGKSDAILGAFTPSTREMGSGSDYIGFVGGYANRVTRLRLFGREVGDEPVILPPGQHRVQLTRRNGEVWLLLDGKVVGYGVDPAPKAVVDRLAVLGGYGGDQIVREIRVRVT